MYYEYRGRVGTIYFNRTSTGGSWQKDSQPIFYVFKDYAECSDNQVFMRIDSTDEYSYYYYKDSNFVNGIGTYTVNSADVYTNKVNQFTQQNDFTYYPPTAPSPSTSQQLANKGYVDGIATDLAPAYSSSSTYAVGDIVSKDNGLFQCNTAISTAEDWDNTHWTAIKVTSLLSSKQDTLVSGTNIKTINSTSLLGSGDITISGGGGINIINGGDTIDLETSPTGIYVMDGQQNLWANSVSLKINGTSFKTIYLIKGQTFAFIKKFSDCTNNGEIVYAFRNYVRNASTWRSGYNPNDYPGQTFLQWGYKDGSSISESWNDESCLANPSGTVQFGSLPKTYMYRTPTADNEFIQKKYVDDSISTAIGTALSASY